MCRPDTRRQPPIDSQPADCKSALGPPRTVAAYHTVLTLLCSLAFACSLTSAVPAESGTSSALETDPKGWIDIQPASDLHGWTRVAIPPTNHLGRAQWHTDAEHAVLVCDGDGGHEMLRFDRELGDCIFHVEFRFTPIQEPGKKRSYNSGVFIRNSADGTIWHQAQLTMDGGYLFGSTPAGGQMKRFKLPPTELRMKPAGEWNTFEVSARGNTLRVWLNGAVTCTYADCEVPKGYIALESEGYRIEFRGLRLKVMGDG
jgi:hypothetical protein